MFTQLLVKIIECEQNKMKLTQNFVKIPNLFLLLNAEFLLFLKRDRDRRVHERPHKNDHQ